jgi:hypothetical protein
MRLSCDPARNVLASFLWAVLAAAGCASVEQNPPLSDDLAAELATAPDWVRTNCNSYWDDGGATKICGVGSFRGTRNIALARTTAVARGRTAMARTLETSIEAILEDHPPSKDGDEQHIEVVSRQITDFTLSGSEMQDTWISDYGTLFALVSLDLATFQDSLSRMGNLPEEVRETVHQRAPRAFSELDRPIEP